MAAQDYATHRHPPKMTGIGFAFMLIAVIAFALRAYGIGGRVSVAAGISGVIGAIFMLLAMSRVYITGLQDRIIKLEMRVRCATLLSSSQQAVFARLEKPQIVALRFASDEELPALLERAEREKLSSDEIKQAIRNWVPDWDRT